KHAADQHDNARAVLVDEPALDRHEPCFKENEEGECPLDRGAIPSEGLLDVGDEERPAILVVRDHHHRSDTDGQLSPAIRIADAARCCGCRYVNRVRRHFPSKCPLFYRDATAGRADWYTLCQ